MREIKGEGRTVGRRGPPPKPLKLKLLAGNPGKRPITAGPVLTAGRPERPDWLSAEAAIEWDRIVPELEAACLLTVADRAALAAYCQAWAELVVTTRTIEAEGRIHKEPIQSASGQVIGHKLKAHPAVRLQRDAFNRVKQFLIEFGLSPAARARLGSDTARSQAGPGKPANRLLDIVGRVQEARTKGSPAG